MSPEERYSRDTLGLRECYPGEDAEGFEWLQTFGELHNKWSETDWRPGSDVGDALRVAQSANITVHCFPGGFRAFQKRDAGMGQGEFDHCTAADLCSAVRGCWESLPKGLRGEGR